MARAVFQVVQDHTATSEISSTKIKRGQDRSQGMQDTSVFAISWFAALVKNCLTSV
jgi:hypothetical protein